MTDDILNRMNRPQMRLRGILIATGILLALVVTLALGAWVGVGIRDWWVQRALNQANLTGLVNVVNYNIQQGRLVLPPVPPAAAPSTPAPAPAPAATKPAEAPPKK